MSRSPTADRVLEQAKQILRDEEAGYRHSTERIEWARLMVKTNCPEFFNKENA